MQTIWIISIAVLLATCLAFPLLYRGMQAVPVAGGKSRQRTLLIVGPSRSGKTSLFQSFVHNKKECSGVTYTSQKPNMGKVVLENGRSIQVVDMPGHPKLFNAFKSYTPTNITFMIDSSTLNKDADSVARGLLEVLSFARTAKVHEICILANKSDFFTAVSRDKFVELIEAEIEQIREQKDGIQMATIEEKTDTVREWLQDLPGKLSLTEECQVVSGSVLKDDLAEWQTWVEAAFT